jgi:2-methylisocitrate lyase-like PEP mutase family enzyme
VLISNDFSLPLAWNRAGTPLAMQRGTHSHETHQENTMRPTRGALFRRAVAEESPLQIVGTITAYTARMAEQTGYKAIYLSGGGVAANSLGMPDLGISTMDDVLTDAQRITDACGLPLMVDIDTGWGGAFNIARTIRHMIRADVAAVHMEDQVSAKRCGHRPGKEIVSTEEMGATPLFTLDELRANKVDIALYCCGAYRAMNAAALNFYKTLRAEGTQKNVVPAMQPRMEMYDYLGYHDYEKKLDSLFAQGKEK